MTIKTDNKCSACGGNIKFSPNYQALVCEHCSKQFPLHKEEEAPIPNQSYNNYDCTSCGAKLAADKLTIATECAFCGSAVVLNEKVQSYAQPEYILPFLIEKEKALEIFRTFCKNEKMTPGEITKASKISKMQGVYVPVWLFSNKAESEFQYECSHDKIKVISAKRILTVFDVVIRGFGNFNKIPVNASSFVNSRFIESIEPFEYNRLKQFDNKYIMGFFADYSDVSADKCFKDAESRMESSMSEAFKKTLSEYKNTELKTSKMTYQNADKASALVPVWFLNITYKKKKYCFTINGQTGKVAGVLPMSNIAKLILFILKCALATTIVTALSLLTGPLSAVIVFAACLFLAIAEYRKKSAITESLSFFNDGENANAYLVQNSIGIAETMTAFAREEEIISNNE